jgi:hypothetical protein
MRKTLFALSTVALVALVQSQAVPTPTYPTKPTETETVTVDYNAENARNVSASVFRVFQKLGKKAANTVERGTEDVLHGVKNAYKNTLGKMVIEYGKTVAPIY